MRINQASPRRIAQGAIASLKEGEEDRAFEAFCSALTYGEGRIYSEVRQLEALWPQSRRILRHIAAGQNFGVRFDTSSISQVARDILDRYGDSFGDEPSAEPEPFSGLLPTRMMRMIFPYSVMPSDLPTSGARSVLDKPPRPSDE